MTEEPIVLPPEADDYLWDPVHAPADADIAELEGLLGELRFAGHMPDVEPAVEAKPTRRLRVWWMAAAANIARLVGATWRGDSIEPLVAESWRLPPMAMPAASAPGWSLAVVGGAPTCDGKVVDGQAELRPGAWLETQSDARALLQVADLGQAEVDRDTRLRILESGPKRHVIELRRGRLEVTIDAPPEQVVIRTPHGDVVDLGCAYHLDVDRNGLVLEVSTGAVAVRRGREEWRVPQDHRLELGEGRLGVPMSRLARPELTRQLQRDAPDWLREARPTDVATLWNVARSRPKARTLIAGRMGMLGVPVPDGGVASLKNVAALEAWWPAVLDALERARTPRPQPSPPVRRPTPNRSSPDDGPTRRTPEWSPRRRAPEPPPGPRQPPPAKTWAP